MKGKERAFIWRLIRGVWFLTLVLVFPVVDALALDPPPTPGNALWWGTWATANLSQKIINKDDIVTLKLDIVGGPPHGFYCSFGNWHYQGTSSVSANNPNTGCFQILDHSPKGDDLHLVTVDAGWIHWSMITANSPPTWLNDHCYCQYNGVGTSSDTSGCPADYLRHGAYGPGDSFTVTLKATCSRVDNWWTLAELGNFSGDWGLGWGYGAQDYYKFGGHASVSLTADPTTLPADGSQSTLTARVYEPNSAVNLPGQTVSFSMLFGILNPPSGRTASDGTVQAKLSSAGQEGNDIVQASIPGAQDQVIVGFTHPDNPPVGPETRLGQLLVDMLVGEPVHAGLGNYIFTKKLFGFPGKVLPFDFEVTYNSLDNGYNGPLGFGWTHSYNVVLTPPIPPSTDVAIKWGDGHVEYFHGDGVGNFSPINCTTPVTLSMPDTGHYEATLPNKVKYRFDSSGRLLAIVDLNGNQLTFTHSSQLDQITDSAGRQINLTYSGGRIAALTSPLKAGNTVSFQCDIYGNLTGVVDPRGKTWGFTYDSMHRMVTQVNAKGTTVVTNTFDASGRVVQQQDGAGNSTLYEATIDATGTRVKVTPPSGNAIWHYYDRAYNLVSITDGEGNQATFATNSLGRLAGAVDKKGKAVQFIYDANGNPTLIQDRGGIRVQASYNALNQPTSVADPLGKATAFDYDAKGNLTGMRNANSQQVTVGVDASGFTTSFSDFRGKQWSIAYGASGLPQSLTSPTGSQTSFSHDNAGRLAQVGLPVSAATVHLTYDEAGNVLTHTDPMGNVTSLVYDDNGDLILQTFEPIGAITNYEYDWARRLTRITDAMGGNTTYTYDSDGNLTSITDPDGITLSNAYDKANRVTAVTGQLGHRVFYAYDANGNVTSVTNEISNTWGATYDAEGRVIQTIDPLGATQSVVYDAAGRVASTTDQLGNTQTFRYDPAGRLVSTTLPDQGIINYANDPNGRVSVLTDPLGRSWNFSYDDAGHVTGKTDPNNKTESYGYDGLGRLISKTLRDGTTIAYGYDANSRLTSLTLPGATDITYSYDAADNLIGITDPSGTTTMTYDKLGRRLTRTDPSGKTIAFSYTPAGRLSTMTYPGGNVVSYAYDTAGRLSIITDWRGNHTTFQYDSINQVTRVNLPNGTKNLYTYDSAGRVVSRSHQKSDGTVLLSYSYTYDAAGHITSVQRTELLSPTFTASETSYTYDPVNRVMAAVVNGENTAYAFDLRGNLVSKSTGGLTTSYSYDVLDRLISVTDGTDTTTYAYDGAGDRLVKAYNSATTRYVREGGTIYCILNGAGSIQSYNIYAGALLYSLDDSGAVRVYHGDERGSVAAITDAGQNVLQSYSYDPYGKVVGSSGNLGNAFQYVGIHGVMRDENGLYHMQARYYDPDVRRFINEDPKGLSAGLNLYGYVGGDPINSIDPQGLDGGPYFVPFMGEVDRETFYRFKEAVEAAQALGEQDDNVLLAKGLQAAKNIPTPVVTVEATVKSTFLKKPGVMFRPRVANAITEAPVVSSSLFERPKVTFKPMFRYRMTNVSTDVIWTEQYGRPSFFFPRNQGTRMPGTNWGRIDQSKGIALHPIDQVLHPEYYKQAATKDLTSLGTKIIDKATPRISKKLLTMGANTAAEEVVSEGLLTHLARRLVPRSAAAVIGAHIVEGPLALVLDVYTGYQILYGPVRVEGLRKEYFSEWDAYSDGLNSVRK